MIPLNPIRPQLDTRIGHISANAWPIFIILVSIIRLDCGNALLFGIPDVLIGKLQRVQNYAARLVVVRCDRRDHITPSLASGEAAGDLHNSATNVPRSERARTYLHRRHASSPPTSASVTVSQQQ